MLKTNAKLLPHKFHTMFRSKATRAKGENEERQRPPMNKANPNADLRYKEMNTYGCRWTAVGRRRSLVPSARCNSLSWCSGRRTAATELETAEEL